MTIYYPIKAYDPQEAYFVVLSVDGDVLQESRTLDSVVQKFAEGMIKKGIIMKYKPFGLSFTPPITYLVRDCGRIDPVESMNEKQTAYFSKRLMHLLQKATRSPQSL